MEGNRCSTVAEWQRRQPRLDFALCRPHNLLSAAMQSARPSLLRPDQTCKCESSRCTSAMCRSRSTTASRCRCHHSPPERPRLLPLQPPADFSGVHSKERGHHLDAMVAMIRTFTSLKRKNGACSRHGLCRKEKKTKKHSLEKKALPLTPPKRFPAFTHTPTHPMQTPLLFCIRSGFIFEIRSSTGCHHPHAHTEQQIDIKQAQPRAPGRVLPTPQNANAHVSLLGTRARADLRHGWYKCKLSANE